MNTGSSIPNTDDFTVTTDTLTFDVDSGQGSTQPFSVPIVNDILVENDETIKIQATIEGNVGSFSGGGDVANVEMTIMDNDGESLGVGRMNKILRGMQENSMVVDSQDQ